MQNTAKVVTGIFSRSIFLQLPVSILVINMKSNTFLLYGANGYTGRLIARLASAYNLEPILAGRSRDPLEEMAKELNLTYRVISLDNEKELIAVLKEVKLVLHAAGPFQYTAKQMADACLKSGTHYLDINGDIAVFEMLKKYNQAAVDAGIMIMPGVGFDVVPTDCIALLLKNKLPDAIKL
ncbi:MAG TPA: saccharopine dehydrogenase NADP-binding domain-containing protein, partial [Ferruginibacter sp.]|nr:saccharopine dehydrogenase NADP-binding domain-containing protein [Ferruginibacter sp.]